MKRSKETTDSSEVVVVLIDRLRELGFDVVASEVERSFGSPCVVIIPFITYRARFGPIDDSVVALARKMTSICDQRSGSSRLSCRRWLEDTLKDVVRCHD